MSLAQRVRLLHQQEAARLIDVAFLLRRKTTGETLLAAGGQWDCIENRYTGKDPSSARIISITESQVPFVKWAAEQLRDFKAGRKRETRLSLALGDRRAGKTVATMAVANAVSIAVPRIGWHGLITWVVGVARPEMQELDRYQQWMLPAAWYDYSVQEHLYRLRVGSEIFTISADNPRTLKRGEANVVLLNEAQKMPVLVLSNAIMGTVDHDGFCLLAANPPEERKGEWIWRIKKGVRSGVIPATVVFEMSSRMNEFIDQSARSSAMDILRQLDPDTARIDGDGECLLQEGKALPQFDPLVHVRPRPRVGMVDITPALSYRTIGRGYQSVLGEDFQATPYMPAIEVKAYGTPALRAYLEGRIERNQLDSEKDQPHYYVVGETIVPHATEHDLCDQVWIAGKRPETSYIVGDASGQWQNARHQQGDDSFTVIRSRRWMIVPPFVASTDQGDKPQNPKIKYRVNLARRLCGIPPDEAEKRGGHPVLPRWFVEPHCKQTIKALEECELRPSHYNGELKPVGYHSHLFDAVTYVLCHLEPRPEEPSGAELPDALERALDELRRKRQSA